MVAGERMQKGVAYLEVMLAFSGRIPGASGFAILEESKEALVDALDGLEEFINSHGLASYFMRGGVRGYGVAELSGAADTLSGEQGEHGVWIVAPRLALLPFLNGPRRLAHIIHGIPEFRKDARIYRA
jgi:hypothetical protein